ncbi:MAG: acetyltransferase [Methanocella sp. PtaU1.Bin125]|nr:MAG: acetyltransferase [Methanocella sp. PtaU1.Bin125]
MHVSIAEERPDTPEAVAMIGELERYIAPMYPHDSEHGLTPAQMVEEQVAFFVVRCDGVAAGCGGLKMSGEVYAEIVRMYVRPACRGRGLGRLVLERLEQYAREHGVGELRLKTGIYQPEALGLYARHGYGIIPAFGPYREHPLNRYYAKRLF